MDSISLEKQIAVIRRHNDCFVRQNGNGSFFRVSLQDGIILKAAADTLHRLLVLRQHLQNMDPDDTIASDQMTEELLAVLDLPHAVVRA